jgi:thioredoxin 1
LNRLRVALQILPPPSTANATNNTEKKIASLVRHHDQQIPHTKYEKPQTMATIAESTTDAAPAAAPAPTEAAATAPAPAPAPADEPTHIKSIADLDALIASHKYVVVDFWAEWCGPCKAIAPIFKNLHKTHAAPGLVAFAKVDVEEVEQVAQQYGVTAMPSFLFFADGKLDGIEVDTTKVKGGGVQVIEGGKVSTIKGADPRNLNAMVAEIGRLAKGVVSARMT